MKTKKWFIYLLISCLFDFQISFSQYLAQTITTGPEKGSLVIAGGGKLGQDIWDKFIDLAGGKAAKIIIIPTAIGDSAEQAGEETASQLKNMGVAEVQVLHTTQPAIADQEDFSKPLLTATGIWFSGGRQWRLADAYLHTRTQQEMVNLLARGGVIGGTSAGATIQGSYMVRGDTKNNFIMMGDHTVGLNFLKNATIDQHVIRRNRQFDLIPVIEKYPDLLGIGIDEGTAIVVQGDQFEVLGISYVAVVDAQQWKAEKEKTGMITHPFFYLSKGQQYDLKNRKQIIDSLQNKIN